MNLASIHVNDILYLDLNCSKIFGSIPPLKKKRWESYMLYVNQMKIQLADHQWYISSQDETKGTGKYFNSPGHSLSDLNYTRKSEK